MDRRRESRSYLPADCHLDRRPEKIRRKVSVKKWTFITQFGEWFACGSVVGLNTTRNTKIEEIEVSTNVVNLNTAMLICQMSGQERI